MRNFSFLQVVAGEKLEDLLEFVEIQYYYRDKVGWVECDWRYLTRTTMSNSIPISRAGRVRCLFLFGPHKTCCYSTEP